jgi:hypothetical protein
MCQGSARLPEPFQRVDPVLAEQLAEGRVAGRAVVFVGERLDLDPRRGGTDEPDPQTAPPGSPGRGAATKPASTSSKRRRAAASARS